MTLIKTPSNHLKRNGRVIMTFSRGWQTLIATRSLGRRGIDVITGDEYPLTAASFSRHSMTDFRYPNPSKYPDLFLDVLEEIILKHKPQDKTIPYVLMPIHKETYLIARHRKRFEPHIRVVAPDINAIEKVHNKASIIRFARKHGVRVPETWAPESSNEFRRIHSLVKLPAYIKLRESASGVGIKKVKTKQDLTFTFNKLIEHFNLKSQDYPIIQKAVPGDDYCVTTLFDHGSLITAMTYRGMRTFPVDRGATVMRETVKAPEIEKIAIGLMAAIKWHGIAQLDFKWDRTSPPLLLEVNPRFFGGLIQSVESGYDYPWLLFQMITTGQVEPITRTRLDIRTETPMLAFLATLQKIYSRKCDEHAVKKAVKFARKQFKAGDRYQGLVTLLRAVNVYIDFKRRICKIRHLLSEHKGNVYDIISKDDPLPIFGFLYLISVFSRHGKITLELITGEGQNDIKK